MGNSWEILEESTINGGFIGNIIYRDSSIEDV
jgi:hypothetical protein